jgi:hypothetical protein
MGCLCSQLWCRPPKHLAASVTSLCSAVLACFSRKERSGRRQVHVLLAKATFIPEGAVLSIECNAKRAGRPGMICKGHKNSWMCEKAEPSDSPPSTNAAAAAPRPHIDVHLQPETGGCSGAANLHFTWTKEVTGSVQQGSLEELQKTHRGDLPGGFSPTWRPRSSVS